MKLSAIIGVYIILVSLTSCNRDTPNPSTNDIAGYRYFPIDTGHWVIYDVDSISINSINQSIYDTFSYRLKEYIPSTFINNSGNLAERIERYVWDNSLQVWNIDNVWTSNVHPQDAEKVEDNIRYIKLSFPVSLNATWNGNALNSFYPAWNYTYTSINQPLTIGSLSFDSTITVLQIDSVNLINNYYGIEKYATGVGMIYKEFKIINYNISGSNITNSGFDLKMNIEAYHQ